mmetsp:Transcript_22152/g.19694  ORF Transcript_22152/g.19694 Transcript_22152/m.19694 type:complete len:130 (+) Transcript_22152:180-569(+)
MRSASVLGGFNFKSLSMIKLDEIERSEMMKTDQDLEVSKLPFLDNTKNPISWPFVFQGLIQSFATDHSENSKDDVLSRIDLKYLLNSNNSVKKEDNSILSSLSIEDVTLRWAKYQIKQSIKTLSKELNS